MTVLLRRLAVPLLVLPLTTAAATAQADGPAKAGASASLGGDADADAELDEDAEPSRPLKPPGPWIKRYAPRRSMFEVGMFGGLFLPASDVELHFRNLPFKTYEPVSGELGLRVGFYPLRHFGLEADLAMMPTRTESEQRAFIFSSRAMGVVQLGLYRLVPFAVLGGGVIAVRSDDNAVGDDADQLLIVGGGLKYLINDHLQLRLDVRDLMSPKRGRTVNDPADSLEVLLGISVMLGPRKKPEPEYIPPDTDGDGILDDKDKCIDEIGIAPDGCPIRDTDSDGFADDVDECPEDPGAEPDGCPIPDTDGDGFLDPDDKCPEVPGMEPDGCMHDVDGDGLLPPEDKCPEEPETRNGFEDTDGCPDELPEEIKKFTGVIEGIYFDTGKATIRDKSRPTLDEAVKVLKDYEDLRVEITGHTDDRGRDDKNLKLSADRAAAVKQYLVDAGVAEGRIETRGAGEAEPIADNKTREGRQKNRRIEFKVLLPAAPVIVTDDGKAEPAEDAADKADETQPAADEGAAEEPAADKPAAEKPAADKPAADKPAADKPAADEPAEANKPVIQKLDEIE